MVSSSAEVETGGNIKNAQNFIPLVHILKTFFLHQKPIKGSPIITYNITSQGILTCFIKSCISKTWNMKYHWLEDCIFQKQIQIIWKYGIYSWSDHFTEHHPPEYPQLIRQKYLVHCLTHSPFPHG